ncbi:putative serine/threonine-protein kinase yakA [Ananas comosus]|uniref:Putative serine/threonine-protein kinase yakA n=1 Tax=Ananas comosus TaxID=4615 RepID=A0A199W0L5_ANACO|nr:putative serine/threonine-protein kinase yakA [Ananas comosus]
MEERGISKEDGSQGAADETEAATAEGSNPNSNPNSSSSSSCSSSSWIPCGTKAFRQYISPQPSMAKSSNIRVIGRRPLVARLTKDIVETFQICNPNFKYSEELNPKRFLTNPSDGVLNDGHDNVNSDLILHVNSVLVNLKSNRRYVVKDVLGQGTFGQVAKCWDTETNNYVAVKIIKNQPAYYQQAKVEVSILHMLNQKFDPDDQHHIVRILDYFVHQRHLCITFEMLGSNLYELIKLNQFKGLSLNYVQIFSKQILHALIVMKDAGIIHCDLKPENILISASVKPPEIKVIDFGSACMEGRTIYSYIQSRYYRSPEVLLGYPYTTAIDMWSFGCIVAELFLGLPLFPGASEYDLLKRMIEILGGQPPDDLLRNAKNASKFFKHVGGIYRFEDCGAYYGVSSAYRILTEEEYEARESKRPTMGKRYFNYVKLEDIIANYPYRKNLAEEEFSKENLTRMALIDFLRGLVEFDPVKRWSPLQASFHPFLTGEPFTSPYKPPPETPRIPVFGPIAVDHNPGGGYWFAAGLSPQVGNVDEPLPYNSPRLSKVPLSYGSSYGSLGSHGSYTDHGGLGSSYGSYGDVNARHMYNSPFIPRGPHLHAQVGFPRCSPDTRWRPQLSRGNNGFGISPGSLGPTSLGASPSQFTPPMQIPTASAGKYGSTIARGPMHSSSLGKAVAVGQYNRRRSWGYSAMSIQPQENASQHGPEQNFDGISSSHTGAQVRRHVGSFPSSLSNSGHSSWRQLVGGRNDLSLGDFPIGGHGTSQVSYQHAAVSSQPSEGLSDIPECSSSVPDPADWDPNYSDEHLLQEDNSEVSSMSFELSNRLRLGNTVDITTPRIGPGRSSGGQSQAHSSSHFVPSNQRTDHMFQASAAGESSHSTSHDTHPGYGRSHYFHQKYPSRFGQQSFQRFDQMNSAIAQNERSHQSHQPAWPNYKLDDPHSSSSVIFDNGMPWGPRPGHSIVTTLPSTHARKDYGRIS